MASDETLKQNEATNQILKAIGDLSREVGDLRREVGDLRRELADLRREMNERFAKIEVDIDEIKQSQFSFDVRLDRVQAMAHDALNIGHDLKADVKILTAEVRAWAADVTSLQQQNLISLKK